MSKWPASSSMPGMIECIPNCGRRARSVECNGGTRPDVAGARLPPTSPKQIRVGYVQAGFGTGRSIGCRRFQREGRKDSPELGRLDHGNRGGQTFGVELSCNGTARAYRPKSQANLSGTGDVRYATHTLGTRTHCGCGLGVIAGHIRRRSADVSRAGQRAVHCYGFRRA